MVTQRRYNVYSPYIIYMDRGEERTYVGRELYTTRTAAQIVENIIRMKLTPHGYQMSLGRLHQLYYHELAH